MSKVEPQSDQDVQEDNQQTVEVEMKPSWWHYAQECVGVARRTYSGMHPKDREIHELEAEDYSDMIHKINQSGYREQLGESYDWISIEVTERELTVLWDAITDMHFLAREKAGGDWSDVEHPKEHRWFMGTLTAIDRDNMEVSE